MKIDKLYTLSQFVDRLKNWHSEENGDYMIDSIKWYNVKKYNEFLKQPLKKEMFVNEIEYPDESLAGAFSTNEEQIEFEDALKEYQEAENKVIFEGFTKRVCDYGLMFDNNELDIFIEENEFKSLHELAECFEGKLKLKNVAL